MTTNDQTSGAAWINSAPAELADAVSKAADLLRRARRPLVTGLGGVSTEAQRVAIAIADRLGGVADWTTRDADAAGVLAFQSVGAVSATHGEIAERAELIIYWRCPATPLPSSDTIGDEPPAVIEVGGDQLPLTPGADYEAIATLRAIHAGVAIDATAVEQQTGVSLASWQSLYDRLAAVRSAALVRGAAVAEQGPATVAAMTRFAQEVQSVTRLSVVSLPSDGNRLGAENVLAWQTGFPMAVCFGRGYPIYGPDEFSTSRLLERGEVDAVLVIDNGELAALNDQATAALRSLPHVVLSAEDKTSAAPVAIRAAPFAASGGTYYRSDGLALPVGKRDASAGPTAEEVLSLILKELASEC